MNNVNRIYVDNYPIVTLSLIESDKAVDWWSGDRSRGAAASAALVLQVNADKALKAISFHTCEFKYEMFLDQLYNKIFFVIISFLLMK